MTDVEKQTGYTVFVKKVALAQGKKLGISRQAKVDIIEQVKRLANWPDTKDEFDCDRAFGALKLNFNYVEGHWIRVFVFIDDYRRFMWVLRVSDKKTNELTKADRIAVETAISEIKRENELHKKAVEKARPQLRSVKGGKGEQG